MKFPIYQRIKRGELKVCPLFHTGRNRPYADVFREAFPLAERIDAQACYDIYCQHCETHGRDRDKVRTHIDLEDAYPGCRPPFPLTWLEWQIDDIDGRNRPTWSKHEAALIEEITKDSPAFAISLEACVPMTPEAADAEVLLLMHTVVNKPSGALLAPLHLVIALDKEGRIIGCTEFKPDPLMGEQLTWATVVNVPMFAFALCNCRNVVAEKATLTIPTDYTGRIRHLKTEKLTYRTLKIRGSFSRESQTATEGGDGSPKSLHLCRGHFANYTSDKPLFGKYAGSFWIPAHLKGRSDRGVVKKDYVIDVPDGGTRIPVVTTQEGR